MEISIAKLRDGGSDARNSRTILRKKITLPRGVRSS